MQVIMMQKENKVYSVLLMSAIQWLCGIMDEEVTLDLAKHYEHQIEGSQE